MSRYLRIQRTPDVTDRCNRRLPSLLNLNVNEAHRYSIRHAPLNLRWGERREKLEDVLCVPNANNTGRVPVTFVFVGEVEDSRLQGPDGALLKFSRLSILPLFEIDADRGIDMLDRWATKTGTWLAAMASSTAHNLDRHSRTIRTGLLPQTDYQNARKFCRGNVPWTQLTLTDKYSRADSACLSIGLSMHLKYTAI